MISPDLISAVTFFIFKSLWESRDETYKLLSQKLKQSIFYASKEYQANYIARHGFIRQEDFRPSVSLSDLYVSPSIIDQEMPIRSLGKKTVYYKEIDYLEKLNLIRDGVEMSSNHKHLIVKGESGIGKTTFLQKLGLESFQSENQHPYGGYIPVFIQISQCIEKNFDLQKMIEQEFEVCGFPEYEGFTEYASKKGKLLILIDEIESAPLHLQDSILSKIKDFSNLYKRNRIVLACRKSVKTHSLAQFHCIYLLGFDSRQGQKYIARIHQAQHGEDLTASECQEIWQEISEKDNTTSCIVHNPFCLSIVLSLYWESEYKILGRTVLYEKILSNLLGASIFPGTLNLSSKGIKNSAETKLGILSEIAYVCLKSGRFYFHKMEINRLYLAILQKKGINPNSPDCAFTREDDLAEFVINVDKNLCQFNNLLIQKILVAHHLMDSLKILDESIDQFLDASTWKDVFIFLVGMQGSDYLISIIQNRIFANINSSRLVNFMNWISVVASGVCISPNQAANRCYVIFMIFEIMLLFGGCNQDRAIISAILMQIKEIISFLDPNCRIIGPFKGRRSSNLKLSSNYFIDPQIMRGLSLESLLDLAIVLSKKADECKLINSRNSKKLSSTISRIKHQVNGKTVSTYHRKICEKNLYKLWIGSLEMTDNHLSFTTSDLQSLYLYCQGACLIVHCLQEAFYVSGKTQDEVIQSLFTHSLSVNSMVSKP